MVAVPAFLLRLMNRPRLGAVQLGPEDAISIAFADRLRAWTLEGRLACVWWHTASEVGGGGGRRAALRYALAKALGLIPGAPDFVFLSAAGAYCIEAKAGRNGLSDGQKDFSLWCDLSGVPYAVIRSADEGEALLRSWGVLS